MHKLAAVSVDWVPVKVCSDLAKYFLDIVVAYQIVKIIV
jgi:hypothetical protein